MATWRLGDPDAIGVAITVCYAIAAALCWFAACRTNRCFFGQMMFWFGLAVVYAILGVNKQFDLQTALTDYLRVVAREDGWYSERREYQVAFTLISLGVGGLLITTLAILATYMQWTHMAAAVAASGQITYICLRVISLHHVDHRLADTFARDSLQYLELSGVVVCAIAAAIEIGYSRDSAVLSDLR